MSRVVPTDGEALYRQAHASQLHTTYEACVRGSFLPHAMIVGGTAMNMLTQSQDYDNGETYLVTRQGIRRLETDEHRP